MGFREWFVVVVEQSKAEDCCDEESKVEDCFDEDHENDCDKVYDID